MFKQKEDNFYNDMLMVDAIQGIRDALDLKNAISIYKEMYQLGIISETMYKDIITGLAMKERLDIVTLPGNVKIKFES